jgi:hypothetical protein
MKRKIPCDYHEAQDEFDNNCIHCVGQKEFNRIKQIRLTKNEKELLEVCQRACDICFYDGDCSLQNKLKDK